MNDTTPEMAKFHHDLLMSRSGYERVCMASSMFDTAKAMAYASFGDVSEEEKLVRWCYSDDFDAPTKAQIIARMRAQFHRGTAVPPEAQPA